VWRVWRGLSLRPHSLGTKGFNPPHTLHTLHSFIHHSSCPQSLTLLSHLVGPYICSHSVRHSASGGKVHPFALLARNSVQAMPSLFLSIRKSRSATSLASHRSRGCSRASASKLFVKAVFGRFANARGTFPLWRSMTYHCSHGGSVWTCCSCSAGLRSRVSGISLGCQPPSGAARKS
jgi:hypothetical protein